MGKLSTCSQGPLYCNREASELVDCNEFSVIIPLRGGSKGIPRKNIKLLAGKPLCFWAIEAALTLIGAKVYVSTEDPEIKKMVQDAYPTVSVINRPFELSMDETATEAVVSHFLTCVDARHVILMQATSPLTRGIHLQEAVKLYLQNDHRPLITCVRKHQFLWSEEGLPLNYDPTCRPRRQDWEGCLIENGAFYVFSSSDFKENFCRCPPPVTVYEMASPHGVEIDEPIDWSFIDLLLSSSLDSLES